MFRTRTHKHAKYDTVTFMTNKLISIIVNGGRFRSNLHKIACMLYVRPIDCVRAAYQCLRIKISIPKKNQKHKMLCVMHQVENDKSVIIVCHFPVYSEVFYLLFSTNAGLKMPAK